MGGGSGTPEGLYLLQPIVVEWHDAATLHGWRRLDEVVDVTRLMATVDRGYFVGIKDDCLLITPRYARHPDAGLIVDELTTIPMLQIVSISPRKETMRERFVRFKDNRTKGV